MATVKMQYGVISADDHVQEAPDVWTKRMSKAKFGDEKVVLGEPVDARPHRGGQDQTQEDERQHDLHLPEGERADDQRARPMDAGGAHLDSMLCARRQLADVLPVGSELLHLEEEGDTVQPVVG